MRLNQKRLKSLKRSLVFCALFVTVLTVSLALDFTPLGETTPRGEKTVAVSALDSSTRVDVDECLFTVHKAYAYRLNAPGKSEKQPRPGHWFHFPSGLLEKEETQRSFDESFDLLLLLPRKSWIVELKPMTRFLLAAAYSAPFARGDLAEMFSGNVHFLPSERVLKNTLASNPSDSDYFRKRIATKRLDIWSATTNQPMADRFIFNSVRKCANIEDVIHFDHTDFIATNAVWSGTDFGRVNSDVHEWFPTTGSVQTVRNAFEMLCRVDEPVRETKIRGCPSEGFENENDEEKTIAQRAVVYQRDVNRKFKDFDRVKREIANALGADWRVSIVTHDDDNPPCLLYHCLKRADLFITPHGFQSMLTMFLPARAYMFEIFPTNYHWTGYKALGLMFGVRHVWIESRPVSLLGRSLSTVLTTKRCMDSYLCRYLARKSDVSFDERSSGVLERIGRGTIMENARIQPVRDIAGYDGTLGSCVASCERNDDCFTVQITAKSCLHFQNVDAFRV